MYPQGKVKTKDRRTAALFVENRLFYCLLQNVLIAWLAKAAVPSPP